jgi:hypothetical protein
VARHNFPNNYAPTLNFLFNKSKSGKLSPDVWGVTVEVLKENDLQSPQVKFLNFFSSLVHKATFFDFLIFQKYFRTKFKFKFLGRRNSPMDRKMYRGVA